ncbi:MAG: class I SAM-dependent methyltransferase [Candidatus Hermodarchaeota archaeon]
MTKKSPREYDYALKKEEATRLELQAVAFEPIIRKELQLFGLQKGMNVLDAGCGTGAISRMIANVVAPGKVYGVDMDTLFLQEATKQAEQKGIINIQFQEGDICNLEYNDGFFDASYCRFVLMHVDDPIETVRELKRVTKPKGAIGISDIDDGTFITYPNIPHFHHVWSQYGKAAKEKGMDRYIGRKLFSILSNAELEDITITAIPLTGSQQAPHLLQLAVANVFEMIEQDLKEMIEKGITTNSDFEKANEDKVLFLNHPGAFYTMTQFFATGKVP